MDWTIGNALKSRNNNFDAIRLVAALLVLHSHSFVQTGASGDSFVSWTGYLASQLGVGAFFITSGFLVTASILAWERAIRHLPDWQDQGFAFLTRHRWLIGTVIVVYKLQDEYFTHIANLDRSEFVQDLLSQLFGQ